MSPDLMIDNAATASQNRTLIDDPATREAIRLNVIDPLLARIEELNRELSGVRRSYFAERAKVVRMEKGGR